MWSPSNDRLFLSSASMASTASTARRRHRLLVVLVGLALVCINFMPNQNEEASKGNEAAKGTTTTKIVENTLNTATTAALITNNASEVTIKKGSEDAKSDDEAVKNDSGEAKMDAEPAEKDIEPAEKDLEESVNDASTGSDFWIDLDRNASRFLILSTNPRSGSSFFADVMTPRATRPFYLFEPLRVLGRTVANRTELSSAEKVHRLQSLFDCQMEENTKILLHPGRGFIFKKPALKRSRKGKETKIEADAKFVQYAKRLCLRAHMRVIKTIRLSLRELLDSNLLELLPDLRVLLLMRDPRAVANSVDKLRYAWPLKFRETNNICSKIIDNLDALRNSATNRVMLVRYEDLMTEPEEQVKRITQFLHLPQLLQHVLKSINDHFQVKGHKATYYSTFRDAAKFKHDSWREGLRDEVRDALQNSTVCQDSIRRLQYKP